jgi:hypothetical protein
MVVVTTSEKLWNIVGLGAFYGNYMVRVVKKNS